MQVTICGKRWKLLFQKMKPTADYHGLCDSPETTNKTIRVSKSLVGEKRLEVIAHECLHAAMWTADEEFVEEFSRDLARILTQLGYRHVPETHEEK